jgi:hypothetical protein
MRAAILTLSLVPYVFFGLRDVFHHSTHRTVTLAERLLHTSIGLTLLVIIPHAYRGINNIVVLGLILFLIIRCLDEFAFHKNLCQAEIELHAKTHFAFLIFVVAIMTADWIRI